MPLVDVIDVPVARPAERHALEHRSFEPVRPDFDSGTRSPASTEFKRIAIDEIIRHRSHFASAAAVSYSLQPPEAPVAPLLETCANFQVSKHVSKRNGSNNICVIFSLFRRLSQPYYSTISRNALLRCYRRKFRYLSAPYKRFALHCKGLTYKKTQALADTCSLGLYNQNKRRPQI